VGRRKTILKELEKIQQLKNTVAQRVWANASSVTEIDENKSAEQCETLNKEAIKARVVLLAEQLIQEFPDTDPVLISLMDGALPFAGLLHTALNERGYKYAYTTMQASSYGDELTSGELKIGCMPKVPLGGRTVFIVDDVCETGKTYLKIRELLKGFGAQSISLIVLVDKVQKRADDYKPEYVGFAVSPDAFLVGMGLDYSGSLRNTEEIRGVDLTSLPIGEEQDLLNSEKTLNEQLVKLIAMKGTAKPGSSNMTLFGASSEKAYEQYVATVTPVSHQTPF
jgi:hypoxanthine phosphoribosyltransferase